MNSFKKVIIPISLFFITMIVFSIFAEIDEVVRGEGKIVVATNPVKIQHFEGGIIEKIYVKEGDKVTKGEDLLKIKNVFFESSLVENHINQFIYNIELLKLNALINNKDFIVKDNKYPSILIKEKESYIEEKSKLNEQINILYSQIRQKELKKRETEINLTNLKIENKMVVEKFNITKNLYKKNNISRKEYLSSKIEAQRINRKLEEAKNTIPIIENEIKELKIKVKSIKQSFKIEWINKYNDIKSKYLQIKEKEKALLDRKKRMIIKSPIEGIINKIYINNIGSTIKTGEVIMEIIPYLEDKIIEAQINDKDRSRIWIGQKVNININAFPSSIYGYVKGEVSYISADSFINKKNMKTFYIVKIKIINTGKLKYKDIKNGMSVIVNILTGKKTIFEYIVKPLKYLKNNSFTEY